MRCRKEREIKSGEMEIVLYFFAPRAQTTGARVVKPATPNTENVTSLQLTDWLPLCHPHHDQDPAPFCLLVCRFYMRLFISMPAYLITAFCWVLKTAGAKEAVKAERMQDGLRWRRLGLL